VPALFLGNFIRFVLLAVELLIFGRVIVSWIDPYGRGPFAAFLIQTTEPILGPVRRVLPRTGMLDLSPLIVLIVIGLLLQYVP
jgi:YggT family protein